MFENEELTVNVCRQPGANQIAEIAVVDIIGPIHWDRESGGYHKKTAYYNLYAYADYEWVKNNIDCSGRHSGFGNDAKICILEGNNIDSKMHKAGYKYLCGIAGEKPKTLYKVEGKPACTDAILEKLAEGSITRKDLRTELMSEGYLEETIRGALNRMTKQKRIRVEGSSCSKYQIIMLPEDLKLDGEREK